MPFVRFSRDKRGYEHTYLIHATSKKGAPTRILYWYRSPPGVKVGRPAFDAEMRRQLEVQYPHVDFDWRRISETPMPTADVEHWRERRRLEKAAKLARRAAADGDDDDDGGDEPSAAAGEGADEAKQPLHTGDLPATGAGDESASAGRVAEDPGAADGRAAAGAPVDGSALPGDARRRRRRGGRRRRRGPAGGEVGQAGESGGPNRRDEAPRPGGSGEES